jgi:cellobiose-specific phosphotransferase system component IIA
MNARSYLCRAMAAEKAGKFAEAADAFEKAAAGTPSADAAH